MLRRRTYDACVSNLERDPAEVVAGGSVGIADTRSIEVLLPRDVPLGGPRAMNVRRTLPQRRRSLIGGWCFIDHYGPEDVSVTGGMRVPPHPHTGLQTVSWLFAGEIEHRDSVGSHALIHPGELNLMTAGRGISHSEVSTPATDHAARRAAVGRAAVGVRAMSRRSSSITYPSRCRSGDAVVRTFVGSLAGSGTDATMFSPLVGAQLDLPAGIVGRRAARPVVRARRPGGRRAPWTVAGETISASELAYLGPGIDTVELRAGETDARVLLLGGEPLGEQIVMWWNFIGRSHEDDRAVPRRVAAGCDRRRGCSTARFGAIPGLPGVGPSRAGAADGAAQAARLDVSPVTAVERRTSHLILRG